MIKLLRNHYCDKLSHLSKSQLEGSNFNGEPNVSFSGEVYNFDDAPPNTLMMVISKDMEGVELIDPQYQHLTSALTGTIFVKVSKYIANLALGNVVRKASYEQDIVYFDTLFNNDCDCTNSDPDCLSVVYGKCNAEKVTGQCVELSTVLLDGEPLIQELEKGLLNEFIVHYHNGCIKNVIRHDEVAVVVSGVNTADYIKCWKATADREKIIRWTLEGECQNYVDKITNVAIVEP